VNVQAQPVDDEGIMWKWAPIACACALAVAKAIVLLIAKMYDPGLLPADIVYSGFAYDFWAASQLVSRRDLVAGSQWWVLISVLAHVIGYCAAVLVIQSNLENAQEYWLGWSMVALVATFALPTWIALGFNLPE
jgi:hypothetical protein